MKSSDSVKGDVTVMELVRVTVPADVDVTVKRSDLVQGDVMVTQPVQVAVPVAVFVNFTGCCCCNCEKF